MAKTSFNLCCPDEPEKKALCIFSLLSLKRWYLGKGGYANIPPRTSTTDFLLLVLPLIQSHLEN